MIQNGMDVAVMEHHVSSSATGFTNVYSQARISYYGISGIPDSYFDGITHVVGGSTGTYNQFVSKYNQRIAVPSNFTMSMAGISEGLDYTVAVTVDMVEPYSGTNLVLQLGMTQSGMTYSGNVFDYVTMRFWPDANGTPVSFTKSTQQTIELQFSMSSNWNLDECEFVAFIQDNSTKEILQAIKSPVLELPPLSMNNAACQALHMVPITNCSGEVAPEVVIANQGGAELTSLDINYQVNNEPVNTYNWTGSLAYGDSEVVELPSVAFTVEDVNDLVVYTTNPNGNDDEDPTNDTTYTQFNSAPQVIPDIYLYLKLDENPGETTYELLDNSGAVLFSGGPFTQPNAMVKDTFYIPANGCYTFAIYDAGGDGLINGGFYALREGNFGLIHENDEFSSSDEMVQFYSMVTAVDEQSSEETVQVFPNPLGEAATLTYTLQGSSEVNIEVYSLLGQKVYSSGTVTQSAGRQAMALDASSWLPGVYFVRLDINGESVIRKITRK
ncbi:MAG: hypothetical protein Kow00127_24820 [Bacteroidales bacterium]